MLTIPSPSKSYDDPMGDDSGRLSGSSGRSSGGSEAVTGVPDDGDDGGGYLSVGDMGVDTSIEHPDTDEKQASADQVKKLTQQRQKALDQGDTVSAQNAGQQLSMARKMRG